MDMDESHTASEPSLLNWWYQPLTEWQKTFLNFFHLETTQQFFFGGNQADQPLEQQVLKAAGSYGRQLGKVMDVLDVLIQQADLSPAQQAVIDDYQQVRGKVNQVLAHNRGPKPTDLTPGYCRRLVSALRQKEDEERHQFARELRKMLKPFANGDEGSPPAGRLTGTANGQAAGKKR